MRPVLRENVYRLLLYSLRFLQVDYLDRCDTVWRCQIYKCSRFALSTRLIVIASLATTCVWYVASTALTPLLIGMIRCSWRNSHLRHGRNDHAARVFVSSCETDPASFHILSVRPNSWLLSCRNCTWDMSGNRALCVGIMYYRYVLPNLPHGVLPAWPRYPLSRRYALHFHALYFRALFPCFISVLYKRQTPSSYKGSWGFVD